eukprot:2185833-Rhodomonas_salina.1
MGRCLGCGARRRGRAVGPGSDLSHHCELALELAVRRDPPARVLLDVGADAGHAEALELAVLA